MIRRIRGRMTASLLLCFLILFASLGFGATYAWFTSGASDAPSLFYSAGVSGGSAAQCAELDFGCYNFTETYVSRQIELSRAVDSVPGSGQKQSLLNGAFLSWWRDGGGEDASLFEKTDYPAEGQILVQRFSYVNNTGIPVYIRMKPALAGFDAAALGWVSGADSGGWAFDPLSDSLLAYGGSDGYFYLEKPLMAGDQIVISLAYYSLAQTGDKLKAGMSLEAIQAENNAVFLDPAWRAPYDAGNVNYKPYAP